MLCSASGVGSSWKATCWTAYYECDGSMPYRYEDLDEKRFQKLCQSLLIESFPTLHCLPVSQPDGGRDAVDRKPGKPAERLIFQVKWTPDPRLHEDPVDWLLKTVHGESKKITRMVREGAKGYILLTNVPATSHPGGGRYDRLNTELDKLTQHYGIDMSCWWRDDLDGRMDRAPDSLKWAYSEVLVGPDAIRVLVADVARTTKLARQDRLIRDVATTQWSEDEHIRFKQVGLDHPDLPGLFVDVPARPITSDARPRTSTARTRAQQTGAAQLFLTADPSRSVVLGAPGQGKSTLIQFLCQAHRAVLLDKAEFLKQLPVQIGASTARVVFRVDLRDYARWLEGYDPFVEDDTPARKRRRSGTAGSVEEFLALMMKVKSGGRRVDVDDVRDIIDRYPSLLAFDGLDEVASEPLRRRVVEEIQKALDRLQHSTCTPLAIVTARPSYARLAEPDRARFDYYELQPLDEALRIDYLRKWSRSQGLSIRDRHDVEKVFRARSGEPHVRELATNPMQLTILLFLVHQRAESVPRDRTRLYQDYMSRFLDRESKDERVLQHRPLLESVTSYLGWHLQSVAETAGGTGRVSLAELKKLMRHYLADNAQDTTLVDVLFTAATTRVWVITSRVQGTFEFDVQPVREFFAAQYLADTAPPGGRDLRPDKFARFIELAIRPYWFNAARFMAGFFTSGELGTLVDELEQITERPDQAFWSRRLIRTLIDDGVFDERPRALKEAVRVAYDDLGVRLHLHDLQESQARPLTPERGGTHLIALLTDALARHPGHAGHTERARLLAYHHADLTDWWAAHLGSVPASDVPTWLRVGACIRAARRLPTTTLQGLADADHLRLALLLAAEANPEKGSPLEAAMVDAVLNGAASEIGTAGTALAADLARVLAPDRFIAKIPVHERDAPPARPPVASLAPAVTSLSGPSSRIRQHAPHWRATLDAARESKGQKNTASVWVHVAREITRQHGRCWLAREIALIGASAVERQPGGSFDPHAPAFGPDADPGTLAREVRFNNGNAAWWSAQIGLLADDLDRACWLLALATCAAPPVVRAHTHQAAAMIEDIPTGFRDRLGHASLRIGSAGYARRLRTEDVQDAATQSTVLAALLAHHLALAERACVLNDLTEADMLALAGQPALIQPLLNAGCSTSPGLTPPSQLSLPVLASAGSELLLAGQPALSPADAGDIVNDCTRYPWHAAVSADRVLHDGQQEPTLSQVAATQHWFDEP